jgi:hypothetical protein
LSQFCEQQSAKPLHVWELGLHCAAVHLPETQSLSQQSALVWHAALSAAHAGWSQVPLVHEALQQSLLD